MIKKKLLTTLVAVFLLQVFVSTQPATAEESDDAFDVTVSCPASAYAGQRVTWVATVNPSSLQDVAYYSWSPRSHGQDDGVGFDQRTFRFPQPGPATLNVRVIHDGETVTGSCTTIIKPSFFCLFSPLC